MTRTAKSDIQAVCKAICNTCYVDDDVVMAMLLSNGIEPDAETSGDFDAKVVELAIVIVNGWVETSRNEGGISVAIDREQVSKNMFYWCNRYGLDADELIGNVTTVEDVTDMW